MIRDDNDYDTDRMSNHNNLPNEQTNYNSHSVISSGSNCVAMRVKIKKFITKATNEKTWKLNKDSSNYE